MVPAEGGVVIPEVPAAWQPIAETSPPAVSLPDVELTGELLYQILAADFAAQRGAWSAAVNTSLQVAQTTRDPRMAQRGLEFALAANNLPRAWDAARLWLELSPQDPQAQQAEVMLAAANGETDNLAVVLAEQLAQAPDQGEAILQTQAILSRLSNKSDALAVLDSLLQGPLGELPEARLALAQAAYEAGDQTRALIEVHAALAARPDWPMAAGMLLQIGMPIQPATTLAEVERFIERNPDARSVRLAYISALTRSGRADAALTELQRMMRSTPEDFELLYLRGAINYEAGRFDEARRWLDEYIEIEVDRRRASGDAYDPTSSLADAEMLRTRMLEEVGRFDEAFALLEQVVAPEAQVQAGLRKAIIRARQGRMQEAMAQLNAIDIIDERESILIELTRAQLWRNAGQIDDAIHGLEAALVLHPESTEIRYDLALLYERQDRLEELEYHLRQIIDIDPYSAHAYNALGYTFADRNIRLDEARELIEQALELRPDDAAILDSMGWVLYRQGQPEAALEYLKLAWQQGPEAEIGAHLGEVLWRLGRYDEAREVWRTAEALEPDSDVLQQTLERLGASLEGEQ